MTAHKIIISLLILFGAVYARSESCRREQKRYRMAQNFYESGQNLLAVVHFSSVSLSDCDVALAEKAKFAYALAMVRLGEMDAALESLKGLAGSNAESRSKLYLAYLDPGFAADLAPAQRQRFDLWQTRNDGEAFKKAAADLPVDDRERTRLLKMQQLMELAPSRSPVAAGIASALVPGLGQAYAGSWQSAGLALALNALFVATTYEFARRDMWAATAASGLILSVTYVGNILNAIAAAGNFSKAAREPAERRLRENVFPEFAL